MDTEHSSDPGDHPKLAEGVQEALGLNRVDRSDGTVPAGGAEMGKDVLHTVAGKETGQFLNLSGVPEKRCVFPVTFEPRIIAEPAMLEPDPVRTEVMPAVTNSRTGRPEEIGKTRHTDDNDEQEKRAPR